LRLLWRSALDADLQTLPPTLTHPTISVMSLVIRDPEAFASKTYVVPRIPDLRLFTAGSESTDLTERCLETGRILVSHLRAALNCANCCSKPTPSPLPHCGR
jgi:hypothetical protein